eukprot:gene9465-11619_t
MHLLRLIPALATLLLVPFSRAENIVFPADAGVINVKAWTLANGTPGSPQAVGDGIADDTAALNAVFAAYPNGNRIIYLPNGTYRVTNTIRFGDNVNNGKRLVLQ